MTESILSDHHNPAKSELHSKPQAHITNSGPSYDVAFGNLNGSELSVDVHINCNKHSTDQHNVSWDIYDWRALTWSLEQFSVGQEDSEEKLLRRFFFEGLKTWWTRRALGRTSTARLFAVPPTALSMIQEVERKYPLASISCMVEVTSESAEEANFATTRRHWDLSAVPNQALVPTKKECVV